MRKEILLIMRKYSLKKTVGTLLMASVLLVTPVLGNAENSLTDNSVTNVSAATKSKKLVAPKGLKEGVMTPAPKSLKGKFYTAKKDSTITGVGDFTFVKTPFNLNSVDQFNPNKIRVLGFTKKSGKEYAVVSTEVFAPSAPIYNVTGLILVSKLTLSATKDTQKTVKKGTQLIAPKGIHNYKKVPTTLDNIQLVAPSNKVKTSSYHIKKKINARKFVEKKYDMKLVKSTLSPNKNQTLKVLYFYKFAGVDYALVASVDTVKDIAVYEVPVKKLFAN